MTTVRRDKLLRLARAGKLVAVQSYSFDDMTGGSAWTGEKPVRVIPLRGKREYEEGFYHVGEWEFMGHGRAWKEGSDRIVLYVHSNRNHTFRITA